jgi:hypothetical protein
MPQYKYSIAGKWDRMPHMDSSPRWETFAEAKAAAVRAALPGAPCRVWEHYEPGSAIDCQEIAKVSASGNVVWLVDPKWVDR